MLDVTKIKKDFPIFKRNFGDNGLTYLDSAASSQKPKQVIDAIVDYYENHNANVHRGVYTLSEEATDMYEEARSKVASFIGAKSADDIVFTKGVTESLNRIAFSFLSNYIQKGDQIMVVEADHHSNIVPWQIVAKNIGAELITLKVTEDGEFDFKDFKSKLNDKVKFIAVSHVSNVLGTIYPIKKICDLARKLGILVSVDGAQAIAHMEVNVQSLGCDFYSFSGHKMLGPMGVGVLWARKEILEKMQPYEYGGGMIKTVSMESSTWGDIPQRLEAGTPNVEGAVGLNAAIDYLQKVGMSSVEAHIKELVSYATEQLLKIEGLKILGSTNPEVRIGLVAFVIKGIHSHDLASVLSTYGIAVRSGQHCTMPLHNCLGINSSVRASFHIYNDKNDIDKLVDGLKKAKGILL